LLQKRELSTPERGEGARPVPAGAGASQGAEKGP
jgi:hypothetical protein